MRVAVTAARLGRLALSCDPINNLAAISEERKAGFACSANPR
jgi:hypothetical protein